VLQCVAPWHTNNTQTNATAHQTFTTGCSSSFKEGFLCSGVKVGSRMLVCRGVHTMAHQQQTNKHHDILRIRIYNIFFCFFFMPGGFVGVVGTGGFVGVDTQWHTNNKQTTITAHQMSALTIVCVLLFLVSLPCVTVGSWVMMCRGVYTTTHQQQTNKHHGTPHIRTDKRVVLLSWFLRHGVEVGSWV